MNKTIYSGFIVREFFSIDGTLCEIKSEERIFVKANGIKEAEKLIFEGYMKNPELYIQNRTPKKHMDDKILIKDIKCIDELIK